MPAISNSCSQFSLQLAAAVNSECIYKAIKVVCGCHSNKRGKKPKDFIG